MFRPIMLYNSIGLNIFVIMKLYNIIIRHMFRSMNSYNIIGSNMIKQVELYNIMSHEMFRFRCFCEAMSVLDGAIRAYQRFLRFRFR